jgi:hypothetical protein
MQSGFTDTHTMSTESVVPKPVLASENESDGDTLHSDETNSAAEENPNDNSDDSFIDPDSDGSENSDSSSSTGFVAKGSRKRTRASRASEKNIDIASETDVERLQEMLLRAQERVIDIQCRIECIVDKTGKCGKPFRCRK